MSISEALSVFPTFAERGSLEAVTEGDRWQVYTVNCSSNGNLSFRNCQAQDKSEFNGLTVEL